MKKVMLILLMGVFACSPGSSEKEMEEQTNTIKVESTKNEVQNNSNSQSGPLSCISFVVGVELGPFYVETEMYACAMGHPPIYVFVTEEIYNSLNNQMTLEEYYELYGGGTNLTPLFGQYEIYPADIEIINSSEVTLEDGGIMSIKEGRYEVHENNIVYLEYEINRQ